MTGNKALLGAPLLSTAGPPPSCNCRCEGDSFIVLHKPWCFTGGLDTAFGVKFCFKQDDTQ